MTKYMAPGELPGCDGLLLACNAMRHTTNGMVPPHLFLCLREGRESPQVASNWNRS